MASAATSSTAVDLGEKPYNLLTVEIPTMTSAGDLYIQGSIDGTTYRRCRASSSGVVGAIAAYVLSSITQCMVAFPEFHCRYVKIETSTATVDNAFSFNIILS